MGVHRWDRYVGHEPDALRLLCTTSSVCNVCHGPMTEIDDLPDWVWEDVWHLKAVGRNHERYYDLGSDLCQGDHGITIRARLFGPGWPVAFEVYRYRRLWPLKDRVREAWRALRGLPYEG